jgi:hypothetical protein
LGAATSNLGRRVANSEPAYPGLRALIAEFYEAVRSGGSPPITPDETLSIARVRDHFIKEFDSG